MAGPGLFTVPGLVTWRAARPPKMTQKDPKGTQKDQKGPKGNPKGDYNDIKIILEYTI